MFGLGEEKKKKAAEPFVYELEKEWKDPQKMRAAQQNIQLRLGQIKSLLRAGGSKEEVAKISTLLNGYGAVLKIMARSEAKKNK
jgi:uncharacterized protein Veg